MMECEDFLKTNFQLDTDRDGKLSLEEFKVLFDFLYGPVETRNIGHSGLGFALMGHFQTGICCAFLRTG